MKRKLRYSLALAMVFTLVSCFEQPVTTVPATTTTTGGGGFGTTDDGGTTDPGGGTTSGDGGYGYPPYSWEVEYAGQVNWYPRDNVEPEAGNCNKPGQTTYSTSQCKAANKSIMYRTTPTTADANIAFQSDINRYKVRITVHEKPVPPGGYDGTNSSLEEKIYCYRRKRGAAQQPSVDNYTALRFRVALRRFVNCNSLKCDLGPTVYTTPVQQVSVNSSIILDFTDKRPPSTNSYFIEIRDVKNQDGNPISVRSPSCWGMRVEVATSYTQDF